MTLIDFIKEFPDEKSYKVKFKAYRDHVGVVCPKYGCRDHYWKRDKESYECKGCSYRQSLRSNTVILYAIELMKAAGNSKFKV